MAKNTVLNLGSGGDSMATVDLANFATFGFPAGTDSPAPKLPAVCLYVTQSVGTVPTAVSTANAIPVSQQGALPAGSNSIGTVVLGAGSASAGTVILGAGTAAVGTVTTNADCAIAAGTAPGKVLAVGAVYNATAPLATTGQSVAVQTDPSGCVRVTGSGGMNTYSAAATVAPAASATDIAILPGSASKTVKLLRVKVSLYSSGNTNQNIVVSLIKRSTANSGGTSSAMTQVPHNSANTGVTAAPLTYTANPTTGSSVGNLDVAIVQPTCIASSASSSPNNEAIFDFTAPGMQPPTLSGVAQGVAVNIGGVTITATAGAKVTFTWTEE